MSSVPDKYTNQIICLHFRLRLAHHIIRQLNRGETDLTPKLRGVTERLRRLQYDLETDADKLTSRIEAADARRETVFKKSHETVAQAHASLDEVDQFITELDRSNSGNPLENESPPRSSEVGLRQVK